MSGFLWIIVATIIGVLLVFFELLVALLMVVISLVASAIWCPLEWLYTSWREERESVRMIVYVGADCRVRAREWYTVYTRGFGPFRKERIDRWPIYVEVIKRFSIKLTAASEEMERVALAFKGAGVSTRELVSLAERLCPKA